MGSPSAVERLIRGIKMKDYCYDCYNSGWDFDPTSLGWIACSCGRSEDDEGNEVPRPTFNIWLGLLVKTALVDALKEIQKQQKEVKS